MYILYADDMTRAIRVRDRREAQRRSDAAKVTVYVYTDRAWHNREWHDATIPPKHTLHPRNGE